MASTGLRQRMPGSLEESEVKDINQIREESSGYHPGGPVKHGGFLQVLRAVSLGIYFFGSAICIHITQLIGCPLYLWNKDWYYAWMAVTKQHFGLLAATATHWWSPTVIRVSGDKSVRGQLRRTKDGRLECDFPERMVLISNHEIYSDWLYLWWIAYTSKMHGHIFIILKESLKYIPLIGWGMMFYGFIFLSRKWATDKSRFAHRLQKLKSSHKGFLSGSKGLDPMWLLIFPEGTNLSNNGRKASKKWADKCGIDDLRHALLPRSTGLQFCLQELKDTVEWIYDCTLSYEGVPRGEYGQDIFTLKSTYLQGRPPKSVNMYWRRFHISTIPVDDQKAFEKWIADRWLEKDDLLEEYVQTGRFPADDGEEVIQNGSASSKVIKGAGYIETEVRTANPLEFLQIFAPVTALLLLIRNVRKMWGIILSTIVGHTSV